MSMSFWNYFNFIEKDFWSWEWRKVNAFARRIDVEVGEGDVGDWGWGKVNAVGITWRRGRNSEVGEGDVGDWEWGKVNAVRKWSWGRVDVNIK